MSKEKTSLTKKGTSFQDKHHRGLPELGLEPLALPSFSSLDSMGHHYTLNSLLSSTPAPSHALWFQLTLALLHSAPTQPNKNNYDNFSQCKFTATNFNQTLRNLQKSYDSTLVNPDPNLLDIDFTSVHKAKKLQTKDTTLEIGVSYGLSHNLPIAVL